MRGMFLGGRADMTDDTDQLSQAIEKMHGGAAILVQSLPVRETFEGKPVWEGVVHVFDLTGHPTATRAYAWSSPIEGSTKRRFVAVLHTARINSPLEAVRAAIVAEHHASELPSESGPKRFPTTSPAKNLNTRIKRRRGRNDGRPRRH
jgi:hypothetical protein